MEYNKVTNKNQQPCPTAPRQHSDFTPIYVGQPVTKKVKLSEEYAHLLLEMVARSGKLNTFFMVGLFFAMCTSIWCL